MKKYIIIGAIVLIAGCSSTKQMSNGTIYKTDRNKVLIDSMYNKKLENWPVNYEIIDVQTQYGKTSLIASGKVENPPIFLIHAMGVTATMWLPNVEELSKHYRLYAINTIGDLGNSELISLKHYPQCGLDYSNWLNEIALKLNINQLDVIGASMGGWLSMNFAINSTDKIKHLILIGPMGIKANTFGVMRRLSKILVNPSDKNKKELTKWTLGDDENVNASMSEYMNIAMNCEGKIPIPKRIKKGQLKKIEAKTLLILGEKDNPVGSTKKNVKFAKKTITNIDVITLNTGHLISMEEPENVNSLIIDFLKE